MSRAWRGTGEQDGEAYLDRAAARLPCGHGASAYRRSTAGSEANKKRSAATSFMFPGQLVAGMLLL